MEVRVIINGINYNQQALEGLSITYGRQELFDTNRSPYARVAVVQGAESVAFEIADAVVVEGQLSTGTWVPLFTGTVSDVNTSIVASDFVISELLAVGTMGKLAQGMAGSEGYPEQDFYDRMEAILLEGLNYVVIDGLSGTIDNQTGTIDNWYNYSIDVPGTPSGITLLAYAADEVNALELANQTAQETAGHLIEDADGTLRVEEYGYSLGTQITLQNTVWLRDSVQSVINLDNLYNIVEFSNGTYTKTFANSTSVGKYGPRRTSYTNTIKDSADVDSVGLFIASRNYTADRRVSQVTIDMDALYANSTSRFDNALQLSSMQYIRVSGLPTVVTGASDYDALAVGWTWNLGENFAQLTIDLIERY